MKKIFFFIIIFINILLFNNSKLDTVASKADSDLQISSKAAVLIEPYGKQILYDKNANKKLFPASMTKIVTLKLVLDAIENKQIDWKQGIRTSKYASKMGGSQIYLAEGEEMSVEDLFKSVAIVSANDAAVSLAEAVAGSEEQFVVKMNQEVKKLDLKNTNFVNCTGLPVENHYTTPYDIGILGINLINKYEDVILKYTSCYEDYVRQDSPKKFWLVNTNKLIKRYPEIDGLKTGWTNEAGYCLTCTMKKDNFRLVSVVMGAENTDMRSKDTLNLLHYGFNNYQKINLFSKNQILKRINNIRLNPSKQVVIIPNDVTVVMPKESADIKFEYEVVLDNRKINSFHTANIGKLSVYDKNHNLITETCLNLMQDNKKASFWNIIVELIEKIF